MVPTKFANIQELLKALHDRTTNQHDPDLAGVLEWVKERARRDREANANATFHSFKPSGKWYASGRGILPEAAFCGAPSKEHQLQHILEANDGCWPGLASAGKDLTLIVIGDDALNFGFPLMWVRPQW